LGANVERRTRLRKATAWQAPNVQRRILEKFRTDALSAIYPTKKKGSISRKAKPSPESFYPAGAV
jgi:hypothetical protein